MHPIWKIPELVELIFHFLAVSDAAVMASVCRTFCWAAMPNVWGNIDTFYKLMQLLPEDALSTTYDDGTPPFTLKRDLRDSDWARFLTRSNYTKRLCVILSDDTSKDYLQLLPHLPSKPLLPNLESTELEISGSTGQLSVELAALFLPCTISEVQIQVMKSADLFAARVIQLLAEDIQLPHLKSFSIQSSDSEAYHLKGSISQLLRAHEGLQAVSIGVGSGPQILEILHSTGQFLHLRHLSLHTPRIYSQFEQAPRLLFPQLETLKMEGPPSFIHAVLDCVGAGNMRSVELIVDEDGFDEENEADYTAFLTSCLLSIGRFISLKALDLQSGMPASIKLLDHVMTCEKLETLRLVGADLDPQETEESRHQRMIMAWPLLTTLQLVPTITDEESSSVGSPSPFIEA
ncbi:hypothetical protein FRC01_000485 [Tulasnella sp. 417]|nr:hypothetical protein FRC01_000485 [Tulasnella sp. 417]